jgi:hypothetical protein
LGCDIHFYVEKKVNDAWQPVQGPNPYFGKYHGEPKMKYHNWAYWGRNYSLFELLADVRRDGEFKALAEPRDLPEDVSDIIAKEADNVDWHSHSYFMLPELLKACSKISDVSPEFAQDTLPVLERISEGDPESIRVVFWFDN